MTYDAKGLQSFAVKASSGTNKGKLKMENSYMEGRQAFLNGEYSDSNPYKASYRYGGNRAQKWAQGFQDALFEHENRDTWWKVNEK